MSKAEREETAQERSKAAAVDELSTMFESKKKLRIVIKENLPYGGYSPSLAGQGGPNLGRGAPMIGVDMNVAQGEDTNISAKVVLHRNGKVLLIKNDRGWDLPGGHIKQDENILSGLVREVFEETGLTLSSGDIKSMNMSHKNKRFFCGEFTTDDVQLSDEHYEFGFYSLEEVLQMSDVDSVFKKAIKKCLSKDNYPVNISNVSKRITLVVG